MYWVLSQINHPNATNISLCIIHWTILSYFFKPMYCHILQFFKEKIYITNICPLHGSINTQLVPTSLLLKPSSTQYPTSQQNWPNASRPREMTHQALRYHIIQYLVKYWNHKINLKMTVWLWNSISVSAAQHRLSALLQLHLHSKINTWLQWIEQRQLQALGLCATYTRGFMVVNQGPDDHHILDLVLTLTYHGLAQDCSNSSALAMELHSLVPSKWYDIGIEVKG